MQQKQNVEIDLIVWLISTLSALWCETLTFFNVAFGTLMGQVCVLWCKIFIAFFFNLGLVSVIQLLRKC